MFSWLDATLAALGEGFMRAWTVVERSYRRPLARLAFRLKFSVYPLLALAALGWLGWDWTHDRSLDSAENAIFDKIVNWRPVEPQPTGRVAVVEIDECSIEYFRGCRESMLRCASGDSVEEATNSPMALAAPRPAALAAGQDAAGQYRQVRGHRPVSFF